MFSKPKKGNDSGRAIRPGTTALAYLPLSDGFFEQILTRFENQIGKLAEKIERGRNSVAIWLGTSSQGTNYSNLATLQRELARVLSFVKSRMSTEDNDYVRMERELRSIFDAPMHSLRFRKDRSQHAHVCRTERMNSPRNEITRSWARAAMMH
jgi:hypothetical protein